MQKNKNKTIWNTYTVVMLGVLVAMTIVLTRMFAINLGFARFTLGSVCVIMAGLWFGPVAGGICGMTADIIGAVLQGYAVNPLITEGAMMWGIIPALMRPLMTGGKVKKIGVLSLSVVIASLFCTLGFTLAGLVLINGYSFYGILPTRLAQFASMTPVYCVLSCMLYFSPATKMINSTMQRKEAKEAAEAAAR